MEHLSGYSFTVLISCYRNDDPNKFSMALQSIADNTLSPVMVVLVVDGSIPDDLNDVILTFAKTLPLNVQRLPENVGLALALNHGLSFVETDFCIRADADDLNLLDRFDQIIDKRVGKGNNNDGHNKHIKQRSPRNRACFFFVTATQSA